MTIWRVICPVPGLSLIPVLVFPPCYFPIAFLTPTFLRGVSGLVSPSAVFVKETREQLTSVTVGANAGICFCGYGTFTQLP